MSKSKPQSHQLELPDHPLAKRDLRGEILGVSPMDIPFVNLVYRLNDRAESCPKQIIALDPGETTGVAVFNSFKLIAAGQLDTSTMLKAPKILQILFKKFPPDFVVLEDYRVYSWKTDSHSWDNLHTARVIGCIETLCVLNEPNQIPFRKQSAQKAKQFCTDEKLTKWGFYRKGERHARDAIRHGCFFQLFDRYDR